jgi:hypothetical protein
MSQALATAYYRDQVLGDDDVIIDLSRHMDKLTQYEDISDDFTIEEETRIVEFVKQCMEMSHHKISKRYSHWLEADRAHDVYVPPDATQFREKAVIADTRAVADTVVQYLFAALGGRNPMFALEGYGSAQDRKAAAILERVFHQHMRRGAGEVRLAQHILDNVRYGMGPTKVLWDAKANTNNFVNWDPRKYFPDPRVNADDHDKRQFVGFTDHISTSALIRSGLYPKMDKYPALRRQLTLPKNGWQSHHWMRDEGRGNTVDQTQPNVRNISGASGFYTLGDNRVVDELWVCLNGYEINVPSIGQIWLVINIIDEGVCIRFQLNPYGQQFPETAGGLFHDAHKTFEQSMYDIMLPMHDIATWLLRSRVDNVQAALQQLIFVDPTQINVGDLIHRNKYGFVRTMPGVNPGEGLFVANIADVTRTHWDDIGRMSDLKQRVSAASDAQQGMPTADGIRSATEIQRVSQMGSQRLGVLSRLMSGKSIRPMVRMGISNIQDALTFEGSIRLSGNIPDVLRDSIDTSGYLDFNVADLQGNIDYLVVDGTLPLEPSRDANTWMNMLMVLNQTGLNMEYKVGDIAEEAIKAMGVGDIDRFKISPEELQKNGMSPSQAVSMMERARGASVRPQEDVMREAEKGNLVPMQTKGSAG